MIAVWPRLEAQCRAVRPSLPGEVVSAPFERTSWRRGSQPLRAAHLRTWSFF